MVFTFALRSLETEIQPWEAASVTWGLVYMFANKRVREDSDVAGITPSFPACQWILHWQKSFCWYNWNQLSEHNQLYLEHDL